MRGAHRPRPGDAGVPPPGDARDFDRLMTFYEDGRADGDFEYGVRLGARGDPRQPAVPVPPRAGAGHGAWRGSPIALDDLDLASRLSFFIWGSGPDAELMKAATAGHAVGAGRARPRRSRRMLADPRSDALATRFARAVAAAGRRRQDPARRASSIPYFDRLARPRDGHARRSSSSTASCARTAACSTC